MPKGKRQTTDVHSFFHLYGCLFPWHLRTKGTGHILFSTNLGPLFSRYIFIHYLSFQVMFLFPVAESSAEFPFFTSLFTRFAPHQLSSFRSFALARCGAAPRPRPRRPPSARSRRRRWTSAYNCKRRRPRRRGASLVASCGEPERHLGWGGASLAEPGGAESYRGSYFKHRKRCLCALWSLGAGAAAGCCC